MEDQERHWALSAELMAGIKADTAKIIAQNEALLEGQEKLRTKTHDFANFFQRMEGFFYAMDRLLQRFGHRLRIAPEMPPTAEDLFQMETGQVEFLISTVALVEGLITLAAPDAVSETTVFTGLGRLGGPLFWGTTLCGIGLASTLGLFFLKRPLRRWTTIPLFLVYTVIAASDLLAATADYGWITHAFFAAAAMLVMIRQGRA
jgi:hypothetical protein